MNFLLRGLPFLLVLLFVTSAAFADTVNDFYSDGIAKAKKGDLDGALADFDKATEMKPTFVANYFARGPLGLH